MLLHASPCFYAPRCPNIMSLCGCVWEETHLHNGWFHACNAPAAWGNIWRERTLTPVNTGCSQTCWTQPVTAVESDTGLSLPACCCVKLFRMWTLCLHHQVPPGCDGRRAGQPDQQPWGWSGHCQAWCEDQAVNHGTKGGDQQTATRAERTGHGLHGQYAFLMVYTCIRVLEGVYFCNQLFHYSKTSFSLSQVRRAVAQGVENTVKGTMTTGQVMDLTLPPTTNPLVTRPPAPRSRPASERETGPSGTGTMATDGSGLPPASSLSPCFHWCPCPLWLPLPPCGDSWLLQSGSGGFSVSSTL